MDSFSTFLEKHMFQKCCFYYHQIFIYVNLTYIYFLMEYSFFYFFGNTGAVHAARAAQRNPETSLSALHLIHHLVSTVCSGLEEPEEEEPEEDAVSAVGGGDGEEEPLFTFGNDDGVAAAAAAAAAKKKKKKRKRRSKKSKMKRKEEDMLTLMKSGCIQYEHFYWN